MHVSSVYITSDIIPGQGALDSTDIWRIMARLPNSSHLFLEVLNRIAVGPARRRTGFNFNKYRARLLAVVTRLGIVDLNRWSRNAGMLE